MLAKKQIAEESLKVYGRVIDALNGILVVGTNQGISEVPRVLGKHIVAYLETYVTQIENSENGRCAGVALEHPLFLGDIIVAHFAGMFKHAFKNTAMKRNESVGTEIESLRRKDLGDDGYTLRNPFFSS